MSVPRDSHTATLLDDGRVVLIGGYPGEGLGVLDSIEVIDPVSMTTAVQMPLGQARGGHAAAAMVNGDVLVVGGWIGSRSYTASAELLEPATGRVRAVADAPYGADALDAVLLRDGRVLVTGGQVVTRTADGRTAATFDPETETWTRVGDLSTPRFKHFSVLLSDGRVLVMGGTSDDETLLRSTEIFDPVREHVSAGSGHVRAQVQVPGWCRTSRRWPRGDRRRWSKYGDPRPRRRHRPRQWPSPLNEVRSQRSICSGPATC